MRHLLVVALAAILGVSTAPLHAQEITGAGSTFAHPILSGWSHAYQRAQADAEFQPVGAGLDYEPIGSQAGIMRVESKAVDFGATDVPLSPEQLTRSGLGQFPIVVGGVVVAVNLEGVAPGQLRLTGDLVARIYLGQVTAWDDAAIRALNPDLPLPSAPIVVMRRSDGSGTTFNFTNYLGRVSPEWKEKIGEGLTVTWPTGKSAKGNEGIAEAVKLNRNTMGYVEFAQARRSGLSYAALQNRAGQFVAPGVESFQAAAESADWASSEDFNLLLNDAPGERAYPVVATTFVVIPKQNPASKRARAVVDFFRWSFKRGGQSATEMGYVPLPAALIGQVETYWSEKFGITN